MSSACRNHGGGKPGEESICTHWQRIGRRSGLEVVVAIDVIRATAVTPMPMPGFSASFVVIGTVGEGQPGCRPRATVAVAAKAAVASEAARPGPVVPHGCLDLMFA